MTRSISSPTPTPIGQQIGGVIDLSSGVGNVNMSHEQMANMLPASSTPPPPTTAPNSMGLAGPASNHSTSNNAISANRNAAASSSSSSSSNSSGVNRDQVYSWIQELSAPDTREHALIELSRKREVLPDLAPMLWNSFGTIAALLQEIVMIYPVINPPTLNVSCTKPVIF